MKERAHKLGILTLTPAAVIAVSTGISAATPVPAIADLDSLGSTQGSEAFSTHLAAEAHQAELNDSGTFLSITWSIENSGTDQEPLAWLKDGSYLYSGPSFAGVSIVSSDSGTRFHPIMDGDGACLCSGEVSDEIVKVLNPGEKIAYWSIFSIPEDVDSVILEIPGFDPIEDIPIS